MTELKEKVALVTGGARGLGEAICQRLARAGARVLVADLRAELADEVAAALRSEGLEAEGLALDVTDEAGIADAMEAATRRYGPVDILVNNAGTDVTESIEAVDPADWDRVLKV